MSVKKSKYFVIVLDVCKVVVFVSWKGIHCFIKKFSAETHKNC